MKRYNKEQEVIKLHQEYKEFKQRPKTATEFAKRHGLTRGGLYYDLYVRYPQILAEKRREL